MTKKEAIELLKQVCAMWRGTLQEHQALQEALQVISKPCCEKECCNNCKKEGE